MDYGLSVTAKHGVVITKCNSVISGYIR